MNTPFDLLMLGHFAVDQVIVDGEVETVSGGGVYYGSVAARRLGSNSKYGFFGSRIATVSLERPEFLARGSLIMGYGPTLERLFGSNLELLASGRKGGGGDAAARG